MISYIEIPVGEGSVIINRFIELANKFNSDRLEAMVDKHLASRGKVSRYLFGNPSRKSVRLELRWSGAYWDEYRDALDEAERIQGGLHTLPTDSRIAISLINYYVMLKAIRLLGPKVESNPGEKS